MSYPGIKPLPQKGEVWETPDLIGASPSGHWQQWRVLDVKGDTAYLRLEGGDEESTASAEGMRAGDGGWQLKQD